jgi:hypothetical protein
VAHSYRAAGLLLRSDIVLPGLIAGGPHELPADVTIRHAPVDPRLEGATVSGPTWQMADDRFLLRIPDIARFLLTGGRDIAFDMENGAATENAAIFLVGTVFGILLHQRRRIVLHASAVCVNGKAVLFCGRAGAGKSTLVAALMQRGYAAVSDDLCGVELNPAPMAHPDGRCLKLWAETVGKLDLSALQGVAVRPGVRKYYVEPSAACRDAVPVGAVYMLRESYAPRAPGITPVNIASAALLLQHGAFRPRLVGHMGLREQYFRAAAAIVGAGGVFELRRQFGFAALPRVVGWLEDHWAAIGLTARAA